MRNFLKSLIGVAAAVGATQAQAATCWSTQAVEAAQVRDFETMLMVSALRCRTSGSGFLNEYNSFIRSKRAALTQVNDELRTHFQKAAFGKAALDAYDRFVTQLANSYGAGAQGLDCTDMQSLMRAAEAVEPTREALVALAQRAGAEPRLPNNSCPTNFAAK